MTPADAITKTSSNNASLDLHRASSADAETTSKMDRMAISIDTIRHSGLTAKKTDLEGKLNPPPMMEVSDGGKGTKLVVNEVLKEQYESELTATKAELAYLDSKLSESERSYSENAARQIECDQAIAVLEKENASLQEKLTALVQINNAMDPNNREEYINVNDKDAAKKTQEMILRLSNKLDPNDPRSAMFRHIIKDPENQKSLALIDKTATELNDIAATSGMNKPKGKAA